MIFNLVNPSDAITFIGEDVQIAQAAILLLGRGMYGLEDESLEYVLPVFILGDAKPWLEENGFSNLGQFIFDNAAAIADFLATCLYSSVGERRDYEEAVARMTPEAAAEYRQTHQKDRRSSMSDIGSAAEHYVKTLRVRAEKETHPEKEVPQSDS